MKIAADASKQPVTAGYARTVYDSVFCVNEDGARYISSPFKKPITISKPGLPSLLECHTRPGREHVYLEIISTYEAAIERKKSTIGHQAVAD
jgi:hypothetical protein